MAQSYQNPFSIWTFISLFYMEFYFPYLLRPLFLFFNWNFISIVHWTFLFLFYLDSYFPYLQKYDFYFSFLFGLFYPFSIWTFKSIFCLNFFYFFPYKLMPNFEQLSTMYIYKHQSFSLSMLTFGQRSIYFLSLSWKLDKSRCHNDYANIAEKA